MFPQSKKGLKKQTQNLQISVLDLKMRGNNPELEIEVEKGKDRGYAIIKIFGPNNKNECTLMINKSKKQEIKFVKIVADEVVMIMLNSFIAGQDFSKIFKENTQKKIFQNVSCKSCSFRTSTTNKLKEHIDKHHKEKSRSCKKSDDISKTKFNLEKHTNSKIYLIKVKKCKLM